MLNIRVIIRGTFCIMSKKKGFSKKVGNSMVLILDGDSKNMLRFKCLKQIK